MPISVLSIRPSSGWKERGTPMLSFWDRIMKYVSVTQKSLPIPSNISLRQWIYVLILMFSSLSHRPKFCHLAKDTDDLGAVVLFHWMLAYTSPVLRGEETYRWKTLPNSSLRHLTKKKLNLLHNSFCWKSIVSLGPNHDVLKVLSRGLWRLKNLSLPFILSRKTITGNADSW